MKSVLFLFPAKTEAKGIELSYNLIKRFAAKVSNLHHVVFGFADKVFNRVDARSLKAIVGADRQVKLLNGHL